jgi:hypothetical protein
MYRWLSISDDCWVEFSWKSKVSGIKRIVNKYGGGLKEYKKARGGWKTTRKMINFLNTTVL